MNLKEQLMARSVSPEQYKINSTNSQLTTPRTWGTFAIPDEFVSGTKKKFRCGNYPVRQSELEKEFSSVKLIALFENRDDAKALADLLENDRNP